MIFNSLSWYKETNWATTILPVADRLFCIFTSPPFVFFAGLNMILLLWAKTVETVFAQSPKTFKGPKTHLKSWLRCCSVKTRLPPT